MENAGIPNGAAAPSAMENAGIPNGAAAPTPSAMENAGITNGPAAASAMENAGIPNRAAAPTQTATPVVREQDRLMPIANVIRIMRRVLPPHAKISDDAKEVIQECVSEFISFVTGEANEKCHAEHRKTVNAEDIIWALDHLGFDDYVLPMDAFLQRMREGQAGGSGAAAVDNSRAVRRAPPRAPQPALHGVPAQVQMQRVMYTPPAPVQGYTVALAAVPTNFAPPRVDQGHAFGGQRAVAQQYFGYGYGEGAYGEGSSNHGGRRACDDEESSSNGEPVPAVGTGKPVAEESQGNPDQSG